MAQYATAIVPSNWLKMGKAAKVGGCHTVEEENVWRAGRPLAATTARPARYSTKIYDSKKCPGGYLPETERVPGPVCLSTIMAIASWSSL